MNTKDREFRMSIWKRISIALAALAKGEKLSAVFDKLKKPPEKSVAFTIAVIALGAKMAKADGKVTQDEVRAFREVFYIPDAEINHAARVFNLARQDVSGYRYYAKRISRMFGPGDQTLHDLLEGLFHIANADGFYHPKENIFLSDVAQIFGLSEMQFQSMRARNIPFQDPDPYTVLGVGPEKDFSEIKEAWRCLVMQNHPDQLIARGIPKEAIKISEKRLMQINKAFEEIRKCD